MRKLNESLSKKSFSKACNLQSELYQTILYYTILYYTILYCSIPYMSHFHKFTFENLKIYKSTKSLENHLVLLSG